MSEKITAEDLKMHMEGKNIMVWKVQGELLRGLLNYAKEHNLKLSSAVKTILTEYLKEKGYLH